MQQPGPGPAMIFDTDQVEVSDESVLHGLLLNTPAWQRGAVSFFSSRSGPGRLADVFAGSRGASRHVNHRQISGGKPTRTHAQSTVDPGMRCQLIRQKYNTNCTFNTP